MLPEKELFKNVLIESEDFYGHLIQIALLAVI